MLAAPQWTFYLPVSWRIFTVIGVRFSLSEFSHYRSCCLLHSRVFRSCPQAWLSNVRCAFKPNNWPGALSHNNSVHTPDVLRHTQHEPTSKKNSFSLTPAAFVPDAAHLYVYITMGAWGPPIDAR
jgi:hypothetical protein